MRRAERRGPDLAMQQVDGQEAAIWSRVARTRPETAWMKPVERSAGLPYGSILGADRDGRALRMPAGHRHAAGLATLGALICPV